MNTKKKLIVPTGLFIAAVVVVTILASGKGDNPPVYSAPQTAQVLITEDGFFPSSLKVSPGTVVIWTNSDGEPHRVVANPYPVRSGQHAIDSKTNIDTNATFRYLLSRSGTYSYHDETEPDHNATIVVE